MEEQHIEEAPAQSPLTLTQKTTLFIPSALAAGGIPALLHAPLPLAAAGVIGAFCLAYKSPGIHEELVKHVPQLTHVSRPQVKDTSPGEWTLRDRMMGRHLQQRQAPDAVQESLDRRAEREREEEDCYALGAEQGIPSFALDSDIFTFSQLLASGFRPTMDKIFLGRLPDGTDITVAVRDLCHVALAGNTGGGKSSLMRLIMAQLCYLKVPTVLLNPHYMPYDHDADEDWTPFDHALSAPAAGCAEYDMIAKYLRWAAEVELPERIALARSGGKPRRACFFVLDELPAIVKHIKQAPEWIAAILREGRKYGLFLIVASQDFLAKTVSNKDGEGEVRKQYRTALYVGGGVTTAKVLLDVQDASDIPETQLGMGTIMLRCKTTKSAVLANVCYVDNESLYTLLGLSTFDFDAADGGSVGAHDNVAVTPYAPSPQADAHRDTGALLPRQNATTDAKMDTPEGSSAATAVRQPHYKRMSEIQQAQFVAAYKVRPNMDHCLKAARCSSLYREHARQLLKEQGLR